MGALLKLGLPNKDELEAFLWEYPLMALRPSKKGEIKLSGSFAFSAQHPTAGKIDDSFQLSIIVDSDFPNAIPKVFETGGRIPKEADFHVNGGDQSLCLGSPLRLRHKLYYNPSLIGFATSCVIPFLYAMSHSLAAGAPLPFGELAHGNKGALEDYREMFGLNSTKGVSRVLNLLSLKKRLANKMPCPCDCGLRVGKCGFNSVLRGYRLIAPRSWYREQFCDIAKVI